MRGFLLSGKEEFLSPYIIGVNNFYTDMALLRGKVSDNQDQVTLLGEAEKTILDWQSTVTEPAIALRRKIGNAKTMDDMADLVGLAQGKDFF